MTKFKSPLSAEENSEWFFLLISVCSLTIFKEHIFQKCHLSICTDVYLCRLGWPSCWRHCVTCHMTAVPAYLRRTTCACLCSRTGPSTELLQMCAVPSLHLSAFAWLAQVPLRNPDWQPKNHAQRVSTTLCLSAVQVHSDAGWDKRMYVYELEVLVFSHESERQEILAGQLRVSTNMKTLIKNRVEKNLGSRPQGRSHAAQRQCK